MVNRCCAPYTSRGGLRDLGAGLIGRKIANANRIPIIDMFFVVDLPVALLLDFSQITNGDLFNQ
jgi:hypothetical protein